MYVTVLGRLIPSVRQLALGFVHRPVASGSPRLFQTRRGYVPSAGGNARLCSRSIGSKFPSVCQAHQWSTRPYSSCETHVDKSDLADGKSNNDKKEYTTIYCFPGMRYLRLVSRFKITQTFFTVGITPPMWYLHTLGLITEYQLVYSLSVATFALGMLYWMSFILRRIIGFIYLHRSGDSIKIAHMNFWGKRRDQTIPLFDVIPLGESGEKISEILIRLKRYSTKEKLYVTLKYGTITDQDKFCEVFGDLNSLT